VKAGNNDRVALRTGIRKEKREQKRRDEDMLNDRIRGKHKNNR